MNRKAEAYLRMADKMLKKAEETTMKKNAADVSNMDDVIDSRDIIARIGELEGIDEPDGSEKEELKALKALAEECEEYASDWTYGETLIRRSYWVDYVEELMQNIGVLPKGIPWYIAIDWETTARNIEQDYASVDFDGIEYLIRNT